MLFSSFVDFISSFYFNSFYSFAEIFYDFFATFFVAGFLATGFVSDFFSLGFWTAAVAGLAGWVATAGAGWGFDGAAVVVALTGEALI